jgi:PPM family protein phosphatase
MTLVLDYAVRSDVGLLREGNEDSAYAGPRLLAVADGMGGHAAGEVASALTIASIAELDSSQPGGDMLQALAAAVVTANARLQEKIVANPAVEGMGTTLTALLWSDGHAAMCHIGDSRGYLLRQGELYQITHDHTLVQSLVDEGRISADDVSTHPQRSLLLRALDGRSLAEPDLSVHDGLPGDRYLLCSDGLSGVVSDEALRDTLSTIADPDAATRQLIELAIEGGGPDNITCIVADVVDTATTLLPLTTTPVLAGAAANAGDLRWAADGSSALDPLDPLGPFGALEDHHEDHARPSRTVPQPVVTDGEVPGTAGEAGSIPLTAASGNGTDPQAAQAGRGHRVQPRRGRRRWPIVTTSLVVLLAVIIGGGYIAWRWSQDQYYVAANSQGQVVIYRGINQRVAGISLSSPYELTKIPLAQVPSNYQQTVKTAYGTGSLAQVRQIVANVRSGVNQCRDQYQALQNWVAAGQAYNAYQAELAQAKHKKPPASVPGPPPPKPGPQPSSAATTCPPSQEFGIPASALPPAAAGQS